MIAHYKNIKSGRQWYQAIQLVGKNLYTIVEWLGRESEIRLFGVESFKIKKYGISFKTDYDKLKVHWGDWIVFESDCLFIVHDADFTRTYAKDIKIYEHTICDTFSMYHEKEYHCFVDIFNDGYKIEDIILSLTNIGEEDLFITEVEDYLKEIYQK